MEWQRLWWHSQIQVSNPEEVENIKRGEMDITKEKIQKILATGARIVLTMKGIDDLCMKYFAQAGALCARRIAARMISSDCGQGYGWKSCHDCG